MSDANGAAPANNGATTSDSDLQSKNDKLYGELVHVKKQLESYAKLGNPDDLRGKLEDYDGLRKTTAKTPEEINKLLADKEGEFERRYSGKYTELEKRAAEAEAKIQKYEVVVPTMHKAAQLFRAEELELVNILVERDLASQDGKIIVKDKDGKPQVSNKDPRQFMSVDEYLETLAAKYPGIVKPKTIGTGKSEGETSTATGTDGSAIPADFISWPKEKQSAWFTANPKAREAFMAGKL